MLEAPRYRTRWRELPRGPVGTRAGSRLLGGQLGHVSRARACPGESGAEVCVDLPRLAREIAGCHKLAVRVD